MVRQQIGSKPLTVYIQTGHTEHMADELDWIDRGLLRAVRRNRIAAAAGSDLERLRRALSDLAEKWQRDESRSAEYQDGLADCAEDLRAVLAGDRIYDEAP